VEENKIKNKIKNDYIKIVRWTVISVLALIFLLTVFYTVDAGERAVLLTFGKQAETSINPGLHVKIPFAQKIVKFDIKTQKYSAEATAASKDLQDVKTEITVNYYINPSLVSKLYSEVGKDYEGIVIQPIVQESVKASTAKYTAEELITKRAEVKSLINESIKERLDNYNLFIQDVSITEFKFSDQFSSAIEAKQVAEQRIFTASNDLKRIEIEKEQTITQSEANMQRVINESDAQAYQLRVVREELEKNEALIQYKYIEKWNGQMPSVLTSGQGTLLQIPIK